MCHHPPPGVDPGRWDRDQHANARRVGGKQGNRESTGGQ